MSEETGQSVDEKKSREAAEEASALNKLTDKVEEKELDASQTQKAFSNIVSAGQKAGQDAQRERERELAKVKIKQADVNVIVHEFEVNKRSAETRLRENKGNLRAALESYL